MRVRLSNISRKISKLLSQSYPFRHEGKSLRIIGGLLFIVTFLFCYIFKPFTIYTPEFKMDFLWISIIHAASPVVIIVFIAFFTSFIKKTSYWNIGKEIILIALFLLLTGVLQFLIRDLIYENPNNWSWHYFFEEITNTFLIGSLLILILISFNLNRLKFKNLNNEFSLDNSETPQNSYPNSTIYIETQVKADNFDLVIDEFLFAQAQGNYVELYLKKGKPIKELKRIPLKELESILKPYSNIMKTHRSYLVNLDYVNNVIGNTQGYKLSLTDYKGSIPVSRSNIEKFKSKMNSK